MAENYIVNYSIKVNSRSAVNAINRFKKATNDLATSAKQFNYIRKEVGRTVAAMNKLSNTKIIINTQNAHRSLDRIIVKLERIAQLANQSGIPASAVMMGQSSGAVGGGKVAPNTPTGMMPVVQPKPKNRTSKQPLKPKQPKPNKTLAPKAKKGNYSYRVLGPSMIDNGGLAAVNVLKGMGMAYGISAAGGLVGNVIKDAAEYNNIIQTTKNILSAHDTGSKFDERFKQMEGVVRDVGVKTKYTAPEVADASRFLAMAGMDLDDIKKSIRPIADIALIGDTELGPTADVVTNIMTGYGISADNLRHTADVMTQTFTMSNVTLMEIASSYKYVASLLKSAGVSFEESTAAIGVLGNAGIKGSQAGTVMRTIMTNLLKPTKSQQKMWNEIGVQRFDKNGNLRDLVDIFRDLSNMNLKTDVFFKMFNTRAAQGAVSLASNIDTWENIIKENLISTGVTKEHATEKQNTIQGLWAQLTSRFTEEGLRSFEVLDQRIRNFLNSIIQWIDSDKGARFIHGVSSSVMDFMVMMKDFTKKIMEFYSKFKPLIDRWIKVQMYLGAALIPLRILKGLKTGFQFIATGAKNLNAFNKSLYTFGKTCWSTRDAIRGTISGIKQYKTSTNSGVANMSGIDKFERNYNILRPSKEVRENYNNLVTRVGKDKLANVGTLKYQSNYKSPYSQHHPFHRTLMANAENGMMATSNFVQNTQAIQAMAKRRALIHSMGRGAASMIGGGLGAYAGAQIGSGGFDTVASSLLLGAAGSIGGSLIGAKFGTAMVAAFTNPITAVIALGTAIGVTAYKFHKYKKEAEEAIEANNKLIESASLVNGINLSEHATMADKYLSIVHDKQINVNKATSKYIDLLHEEYGAHEKLKEQAENKTKAGEKYKDEVENWSKPFGWSTLRETWMKAPLSVTGEFAVESLGKDDYSDFYKYKLFDRVFFDYKDSFDKLRAAQIVASKVGDVSENSSLSKQFAKYDKLLLAAKTTEDIDAVLNQVQKELDSLYYDKESLDWTTDDIANKTIDQWNHSWAGYNILKKRWKERYDINNPNSDNYHVLKFQALVKILEAYQNDQEIENEQIYEFLKLLGGVYFDEDRFGKFGSPAWLKNLGFDIEKNQWVGTSNKTAEQARMAFTNFHQSIIDMVNHLNPAIRKYFDNVVNNFMFNLPTLDKDGNAPSTNVMYNGAEYQFDGATNTWYPVDNNILSPIHNSKFETLTGKREVGGLSDVTGNTKGNIGTSDILKRYNTGGDSNQYKKHYGAGNAAPKQINVTIKNLMNVDKIDMNDPNKKEIIENIKSEMAYALIDVVRDFDETFHG